MVDSRGKSITFGSYIAITDMHGGLYAVQYTDGTWHIPARRSADYGNYQGAYDSIAVVDSFTIGYNTKSENGKPYRNADLWLYPGWHAYRDIDSISPGNGKLLIILHEKQMNPYTHVLTNRAMIVTSDWRMKSPAFFATDSMLLKNVIVTSGEYGNKQAMLLTDGRITAWFDTITRLPHNFHLVHTDYGMGVLNSRGELTINLGYQNVEPAGDNFVLTAGMQLFLADTNGKKLSADYGDIIYFSNGISLAWWNATDTVFSLLNAQGKATAEKYGYIYHFSEGRARVISRGFTQYTYVDSNGIRVTPWYDYGVKVPYSGDGVRHHDLVLCILSQMYGDGVTNTVFRRQPHYRTPEPAEFPGNDRKYDYFYGTNFKNGTAINSVWRESPSYSADAGERYVYYGVIDTSGKQLLKPIYENITRADTFFILQKGNLYGIADGHGKIILQPKYGTIDYLGENLFSVQDKSAIPIICSLYRIDRGSGTFCSGFIFSRIFDFKNGKAFADPVKGEDYEIDRFGKKVE